MPLPQTFTSESVTEGHPDKIADAISDRILDAYLTEDPQSRVAVETLVAGNNIVVAGEVRSQADVDIADIVRKRYQSVGYTAQNGYAPEDLQIVSLLTRQSPEIAGGVDHGYSDAETARLTAQQARVDDDLEETSVKDQLGAGDQGLMFGYATDETEQYLPTPGFLAHMLSLQLTSARKKGALPFLGPDGKTQVTVLYENDTPVAVDTVVVSTQHSRDVDLHDLRTAVMKKVVYPILETSDLRISDTKVLINPAGEFVLGGPLADAGVTGRKIIVDTYGGMARHGGGAFSGKDGTKVDRSMAYALRWVAKNIVAAKLAKRIEVQAAYAIGVAEPVGIYVNTFGTGVLESDELYSKLIRSVFDLRPQSVIASLELTSPIFSTTTNYGHFGKSWLPWERIDMVNALLQIAKTIND